LTTTSCSNKSKSQLYINDIEISASKWPITYSISKTNKYIRTFAIGIRYELELYNEGVKIGSKESKLDIHIEPQEKLNSTVEKQIFDGHTEITKRITAILPTKTVGNYVYALAIGFEAPNKQSGIHNQTYPDPQRLKKIIRNAHYADIIIKQGEIEIKRFSVNDFKSTTKPIFTLVDNNDNVILSTTINQYYSNKKYYDKWHLSKLQKHRNNLDHALNKKTH